jgi:hypothetical protein
MGVVSGWTTPARGCIPSNLHGANYSRLLPVEPAMPEATLLKPQVSTIGRPARTISKPSAVGSSPTGGTEVRAVDRCGDCLSWSHPWSHRANERLDGPARRCDRRGAQGQQPTQRDARDRQYRDWVRFPRDRRSSMVLRELRRVESLLSAWRESFAHLKTVSFPGVDEAILHRRSSRQRESRSYLTAPSKIRSTRPGMSQLT